MIAKTYACSLLGIDAILVIRLVNDTANYHVNGSRGSPRRFTPRSTERRPLNECRLCRTVAGRLVEVEVDLFSGFPGFVTVGLPDKPSEQ
jgi:hypothetical protein